MSLAISRALFWGQFSTPPTTLRRSPLGFIKPLNFKVNMIRWCVDEGEWSEGVSLENILIKIWVSKVDHFSISSSRVLWSANANINRNPTPKYHQEEAHWCWWCYHHHHHPKSTYLGSTLHVVRFVYWFPIGDPGGWVLIGERVGMDGWLTEMMMARHR